MHIAINAQDLIILYIWNKSLKRNIIIFLYFQDFV
jgi:hypothetical protein